MLCLELGRLAAEPIMLPMPPYVTECPPYAVAPGVSSEATTAGGIWC